jgi:hypothetical protein
MSTKSALRADLDAEDRKTLAEDRKRMERLGKGSQLDDWLAFGPGLLIRRRLAKNIAGLAETDPAKGHRYSRAFKQQMEMDSLYDRTTKSDVMKSTFTAVLWFYDDEKLEEPRREILEEIRRNMTPGQRARFNSPISAQQRVLDELRTRGLAPAKKPRAPKPANDLDQANARIVELEEELKSPRSIAPVTDIAEQAAEPTDLQAYLETALTGMVGDFVRESASVDIPQALRGCEKAELERLLASVRSASQWLKDLEATVKGMSEPQQLFSVQLAEMMRGF